jgi:hypothetical protein
MRLKLIKGRIENFQSSRQRKNTLTSTSRDTVTGVGAVVFAAAGMAGAGAQTASNADLSDEVTFYFFQVDGQQYSGHTFNATFKNDDEIELVYEQFLEEKIVKGIRRPMTRSIWLEPYVNKGTLATKRRMTKDWLSISAFVSIVGIFIVGLAELIDSGSQFNFLFFGVASLSFSVFSYVVVGLGFKIFGTSKFMQFARQAEAVFNAFGFQDTPNLDLEIVSNAYRDKNKIDHAEPSTRFELWY